MYIVIVYMNILCPHAQATSGAGRVLGRDFPRSGPSPFPVLSYATFHRYYLLFIIYLSSSLLFFNRYYYLLI